MLNRLNVKKDSIQDCKNFLIIHKYYLLLLSIPSKLFIFRKIGSFPDLPM